MRNDQFVSRKDISIVLGKLRAEADDGWVLVDYVEKLFRDLGIERQKVLDQGGWVRGWRDIGARLGRSPGALAVRNSLGNMPIEPTYFGQTPAYTEGQIQQMLDSGRFRKKRRGNKDPEDS